MARSRRSSSTASPARRCSCSSQGAVSPQARRPQARTEPATHESQLPDDVTEQSKLLQRIDQLLSQHPCTHSRVGSSYVWDAKFGTRQEDKYADENVSFYDARKSLDADGTPWNQFFDLSDGLPDGGEDEDTGMTLEEEKLAELGAATNVSELEQGTGDYADVPVATLDQRAYSAACRSGVERSCESPLSAAGLYQELGKLRFPAYPLGTEGIQPSLPTGSPDSGRSPCNPTTSLSASDTTEIELESSQVEEGAGVDEHATLAATTAVNAERTILYMTDITAKAILPLVLRVSGSRKHAVQLAIRHHFFYQASNAIECQVRFVSWFAFHLASFEWRVSDKPRIDQRSCQGKPLRRTWDLSFLGIERPGGGKTFLHEVISSVLVVGQDFRTWEAYGFFDTYHGDNNDRALLSYSQVEQTPDSPVKPDLIFLGSHVDCNIPMWNMRAYFLRAWQSHMVDGQVRSWQDLADRLEKAVDDYIQKDHQEAGSSRRTESETERGKRRLGFSRSMLALLNSLTDVLDGMLNSWERFFDGPIHYFDDCKESQEQNYIPDIQICVTKLKECLRRLINLRTRCSDVTSLFCLELQAGDSVLLAAQSRASDLTIRMLWVTTGIFLPLNYVTSLFNIPSVLDFAPNMPNYIKANLGAGAVVLVLLSFVYSFTQITTFVTSLSHIVAHLRDQAINLAHRRLVPAKPDARCEEGSEVTATDEVT